MSRHARRDDRWRKALPGALAVLAVTAGVLAFQLERPGDAPEPIAQGVATTPVLSARRVPELLAAPVADLRLQRQLADFVAGSPGANCLVVSDGGRRIYGASPDAPVVPASLQKLLTGTAALEVLGPDTTFSSTLVSAAPPRGGVIDGDLWFVGGGDPLLMTAPFLSHLRHPPPERTDLTKVAEALAAAGVTHVTGRLLGDDSRYDRQRYEPSWPGRFASLAESGPLSALNVNDGLDEFPDAPDTHVPKEHPADDPPANAAARLGELLAAQGITVDGGTGSGVAPAGAGVVAEVKSAPVSGLVAEMERESDNETAEMLVKEMGRKAGAGATTAEGVKVLTATLRQLGLPLDGSVQVDGSGLSSDDKVTCTLIDALLTRTGKAGTIGGSLPVAGRTGTLEKRFVDAPVAGRLAAKTGTLNQVTSLAGFLPTAKGAGLQFSYVLNLDPPTIVGKRHLALEDDLAAILDAYPEGPDLAALGPLP